MDSKSGFFKVGYDIEELPFYYDEKFTRTACWIDLLRRARWDDKPAWFSVRGNKVVIGKNQLAVSERTLSTKWKLNRKTVRERLKDFEELGLIKIESKKFVTVITILNAGNAEKCTTENSDKHNDSECFIMEECTTECTTECTNNKNSNKEKNRKKDGEAKASMFHGVAGERAVGAETEHLGIDLERFASFFNREIETAGALIKPIKGIRVGTRRRTAVLARLRESGKDGLREAVEKAARSDFLNGRNGRGWLATFDWIFRPENFQKVLEGNYDNGDKNDIRQKSNGNTDGNNGNNKGVGGRLSYEDVCKAVIVGNSLDE